MQPPAHFGSSISTITLDLKHDMKKNPYGLDEPINFPKNPYDRQIFMDQYEYCWEFQKENLIWINLDVVQNNDE